MYNNMLVLLVCIAEHQLQLVNFLFFTFILGTCVLYCISFNRFFIAITLSTEFCLKVFGIRKLFFSLSYPNYIGVTIIGVNCVFFMFALDYMTKTDIYLHINYHK